MAQDDKPVADKGKAPAEKQTTEVPGAKEPQEKTTKDGKKPVDLPAGMHKVMLGSVSILTLSR
jgi:26S proteasome regulatory subunit N1